MPDASPQRANVRRIVCLSVAISLLCLAGYRTWRRATEQTRAIDAIVATGGRHVRASGSYGLEMLLARLLGDRGAGDNVLLQGPQIDDAWLAAHHDLRSLDIRELMICDTGLSRESVLRLVERHSLDYLAAPGIPLTDDDAAILANQEHLTRFILMQSRITGAGLAALGPQRLQALNVAGTDITSADLQQELAGAGQLQYLVVDGRQFTPELAAQLSQMGSLNMLGLMGPDVTDAQVKLLESMSNLRHMRLEQTSATDAGIASLRTARPAPAMIEVAPPGEVLFKWRTE
ncbi:MAG: hypothetical protein JNG89_04775 [Planctomycetaceae bacterium]|nr:hypothetical protein [Planctomycetaceae bacterium]